jgi:hypothetical protein
MTLEGVLAAFHFVNPHPFLTIEVGGDRGEPQRWRAVIGAVVGIVFGLISAGMSDCPGDDPGGSCPGTRAVFFLFSTGVYAAIGTGADALIPGRTLLYEAPAAARSSLGGRVAPGAGCMPARLAFRSAVRW